MPCQAALAAPPPASSPDWQVLHPWAALGLRVLVVVGFWWGVRQWLE